MVGNPVQGALAVSVEVRYTGDGEWFWTCPEPGCGVWRIGFTEAGARRMAVGHLNVAHGCGLPVDVEIGNPC